MALSQPDWMCGDVVPAYVRHKPEQTLLYQLLGELLQSVRYEKYD